MDLKLVVHRSDYFCSVEDDGSVFSVVLQAFNRHPLLVTPVQIKRVCMEQQDSL